MKSSIARHRTYKLIATLRGFILQKLTGWLDSRLYIYQVIYKCSHHRHHPTDRYKV